MLFRLMAAAGVAAVLAVPSSVNAQVLMQRELSVEMALTIAETALAECTARVSVAVVDRAGRLKRLPAGRRSVAAQYRARRPQGLYGATRSGAPRSSGRSAPRPRTQGQRSLANVIPLQGGVPIKVGEETIGGVGLSGAPNGGPQEEACGKAGIAKVADQLK